MSNANVKVPVVCTRGIIVFPGQDVMIEVGRSKSINAVNLAVDAYDKMVWIVCQQDMMVDNPGIKDLYSTGTLAKIKVLRKKEGFMRVTFTGMKRARLVQLEDSDRIMMADVEPVDDIHGDPMEEMALVKRIISEFEHMSTITASFPQEVIRQFSNGVSAVALTDQFAQYFMMDQAAKQKLLETADVNERMLLIIAELNKQQKYSQIEHSSMKRSKSASMTTRKNTSCVKRCVRSKRNWAMFPILPMMRHRSARCWIRTRIRIM